MKSSFLILSLLVTIISKGQSKIQQPIDSATAVKIAKKAWEKKYGKIIYNSIPFYAQLKSDSVWFVSGTKRGTTGGVPYAEIKRKDGTIVFIIHMK